MYYTIVCTAALLFALQFMFSEGYQKESGSSMASASKYSIYSSAFGFVILLVINGFKFQISLFSFAVAIVYGALSVLMNYSTVKVFESGNLSLYSVFSMIGGMIIPFLYGVAYGEKMTFMKVLCCLLITLSLIMTISKSETSKKALKHYIIVFIVNGVICLLSKIHPSYPAICVDSGSFVMLTRLTTLLFSSVLLLLAQNGDIGINLKSCAYCIGGAAFNGIGNLLLVIGFTYLPASVQAPMITGGVIVFSTLIDVLRKIKIGKKAIVATIVACAATVLMAF